MRKKLEKNYCKLLKTDLRIKRASIINHFVTKIPSYSDIIDQTPMHVTFGIEAATSRYGASHPALSVADP